jgi:hypothetical protein
VQVSKEFTAANLLFEKITKDCVEVAHTLRGRLYGAHAHLLLSMDVMPRDHVGHAISALVLYRQILREQIAYELSQIAETVLDTGIQLTKEVCHRYGIGQRETSRGVLTTVSQAITRAQSSGCTLCDLPVTYDTPEERDICREHIKPYVPVETQCTHEMVSPFHPHTTLPWPLPQHSDRNKLDAVRERHGSEEWTAVRRIKSPG